MTSTIASLVAEAQRQLDHFGVPMAGDLDRWALEAHSKLEPTVNVREAKLRVSQALAIALWARDGFNVLKPSRGLAAALAVTDVTAAFAGARLPFGSVLVDMTTLDPDWTLLSSPTFGSVRCPYLQVAEWRWGGKRILYYGLVARGWRMMGSVHPEELFFSDVSFEDRTTESVVRAQDASRRFGAALMVWWSTSKESAERAAPAQRGRQAERRHRQRPAVWILGRGVQVHHGIATAAKAGRCGAELQTQHVVRGHFKQQPCGPARAQRKTLWVEPYWRGPDTKVAWQHVYEARES